MHISPITNNYYTRKVNPMKVNNAAAPKFKGSLSDIDMKNNLNKLRIVLSNVVYVNDINGLKEVADKMADKFSHWGVNSIGMMIVPNKDLKLYSNGQVTGDDAKDKIGVYVATGDKNGPVETWDVAYESKLVVLPKACLEKLQ